MTIKTSFGVVLEVSGKGDAETVEKIQQVMDEAYQDIKKIEKEVNPEKDWEYYS